MMALFKVAGITAGSVAIAGFVTQPVLRSLALKWSGLLAPGGGWRLFAVLLLLGNLKNLPFVWHFRFFCAFFYHLYFQPTPIPPHSLFQPIVSTTRAPIMECDYNCHKSNSTYFSDLDISRTHLFTAIFGRVIKKNLSWFGKAKSPAGESGGKMYTALGGVSCFFKREIRPYQKYEMWTRILCWDRKWIYMVTHLVKPGVAKPPKYTLQPRKASKSQKEITEEQRIKLKNAVYCTAISRYVIKRGRITVPSEEALLEAEMLPPKPEGWVYKGDVGSEIVDDVAPASFPESEWNWDVIEAERRRGLRFAEAFAHQEGLHDLFDGGENGILGKYADITMY
ncbi:hypothetical protein GQ43DRAFT_462118 [Delitschia confertaspora ATCC 74209]|uniref:Capsule polysaccharide biosynthesis protein n=1 Tax=Delitschia confertaspora ATCC 74209 TaxID=1513339 RepID=A0A9P4JPC8_9PLEO|nr:hypothetical protein GQ43DRAFT_462118 [Delitschia confertaspora ATCC 74209]